MLGETGARPVTAEPARGAVENGGSGHGAACAPHARG
jgi:hypothetical protein